MKLYFSFFIHSHILLTTLQGTAITASFVVAWNMNYFLYNKGTSSSFSLFSMDHWEGTCKCYICRRSHKRNLRSHWLDLLPFLLSSADHPKDMKYFFCQEVFHFSSQAVLLPGGLCSFLYFVSVLLLKKWSYKNCPLNNKIWNIL